MKLGMALTSAAMAVTLTLGGCATMNSDVPLTTEQKIAGCIATVAIGALAGAVIGNNTGSGDAGSGAAWGAAAGGAACAVWLAFENEKDKRRLAEAQLAAINSNTTYTDTWTGEDGRARTVTVVPSSETAYVPAPSNKAPAATEVAAAPKICRSVATTATVNGQAQTMDEIWCRDEAGNFQKSTEPMVAQAV
jgi:surface antigen